MLMMAVLGLSIKLQDHFECINGQRSVTESMISILITYAFLTMRFTMRIISDCVYCLEHYEIHNLHKGYRTSFRVRK